MIRIALVAAALAACSSQHERKAEPILQQDVEQVVASPHLDATLRVHGVVERGSIHAEVRDTVLHHTFTLARPGATLAVHITGPVPDTLRDDVELIATGKLARTGSDALVLEATELAVTLPRF